MENRKSLMEKKKRVGQSYLQQQYYQFTVIVLTFLSATSQFIHIYTFTITYLIRFIFSDFNFLYSLLNDSPDNPDHLLAEITFRISSRSSRDQSQLYVPTHTYFIRGQPLLSNLFTVCSEL